MSNGQLPKEANGLQLNFCKTLACDNFGLSDADRYVLQRVNPKRPAMVCRECGAFPPLLNNQEVLNELQRLRLVHNDGLPACRNPECKNFGFPVHTHKSLYHAFGYSGDRQRYRCKACHSTFVDKWSGENKNIAFQENLLALLFMGYSVREICRKLEVNPKTFYDHLDHIASRCRRKLAMYDARWASYETHYKLASHFIPLQPQSHNGVFWFVTGEMHSGYILSQHINYSTDEEPKGSLYHNPYESPSRFVSKNFSPEANASQEILTDNLRRRIDRKYQAILARGNVEDPMGDLTGFNYPAKGALIRPPYTSYAHFMHVLEMCNKDKRVTLCFPQDPILRSAALTISLPRIKSQNIDLLYVEEEPGWTLNLETEKIDIVHMGWWRDRWAISEQPGTCKGICYLAGDKPDPKLWLQTATTRKIVKYQNRFQLLFSRFINEPRRKLRPGGLLPMLDIFRAWHNLCYQDRTGYTSAQKLGLAEQPLTLKQLLS